MQSSKQMNNQGDNRLNEKFIDLMEQLSDIMLKRGEPFRARAYQKAQQTIMSYPDDILSPDDLKDSPGIGKTIMEKLNEYVETGTLQILEREKLNPINILSDVYGIGPKKAKELVDNGITSIEQLRANQDLLNDIQRVGLRYYEDILKRIPRSEIEDYKVIFEDLFPMETNSKMEIVGSYRRGALNSGDIDVIITSNNANIFTTFIDNLIKEKIITHVLSRGPTKCLVIAKIPSSNSYRRVDFLYTTQEEFPFAILYFTGSKIFNTVMRHIALENGYTMNEHGMYTMQDKKKGSKINHTFTNEADIFDFLGLMYKAPHERIDGRAVIFKNDINMNNNLNNNLNNMNDLNENVVVAKKKTGKTLKKKGSPVTKTAKKTKPVKSKKVTLVIEDDEDFEDDDFEDDNDFVNNGNHNNHNSSAIISGPSPILLANNFRKYGLVFLQQLNEEQLNSIIYQANIAYYNEEPFLTDNEYDIPNNTVIHEIGAQVQKNKVQLPYHMGSMDKIKPDTNALVNWLNKYHGPYVITCKLDGVSGLYTTEGSVAKLYTRGDGKVGQDVSHLIPYLRLPKTKGIVIRGEFIIPKQVFVTKYKDRFANPRNMVAGIINHKTINENIQDLHFVAYEVIKPVLIPSQQMAFLLTQDVEVVLYRVEAHLTNLLLSQTLIDLRENYPYEIDGIIVTNDATYKRKTSGNPEHAFAFKMVLSDQIAEAKVVDVIWSPSKDGYLKPRVQIEPINLGGVRIEYATGFNGAFINDNKVGVGAIIELIRSGDVIPHIRKVTVPASQAKMPLVPYKWNDSHVDIMLEDIDADETVKEKVITGFFKGIGVDGLSSGNVSRIINAGYDTIPKIINMTMDDFMSVDGFQAKTSAKLYNGIREKLDTASLITIMSASNLFGRGFNEKKLELIMSNYPNVLVSKETRLQKIEKIAAIKGMAEKTSEAFVERIPNFMSFIQEIGLTNKIAHVPVVANNVAIVDHPLYGKTIVMSGFRDAELKNTLKEIGAKVGESVSKNTFILLVKDKNEGTGKISDAVRLGVPIMTVEEFKNEYL
jgi:NAD-dependent DNA ligase/DNA polymerase/3'-5' exonuclease PolX